MFKTLSTILLANCTYKVACNFEGLNHTSSLFNAHTGITGMCSHENIW